MPEEKFEEAVKAKRAAIEKPRPKPKRKKKPKAAKPPHTWEQKRLEEYPVVFGNMCGTINRTLGDEVHRSEIPPGLTAETAAKLLPDIEKAIGRT